MTILVTGGAGYIGSHMVHALNDAGERVVVLDNLSTGFRFLVPPSVPFVVGSTGDRELVTKTIHRHGVSAIIHFAASIVVPESVADPLAYYRNNTMNTCTLLDAAHRGRRQAGDLLLDRGGLRQSAKRARARGRRHARRSRPTARPS